MTMSEFSLTEISITAVAIIGACGSFLAILERSRCSNIDLCCGLINCKRKVPDIEPQADIERP